MKSNSALIIPVVIAAALLLFFLLFGKRKPADLTGERAIEDARRTANLLAAEIRLDNPGRVSVGRDNRDIYERLSEEIERARKVYESRVGTDEVARDLFDQALVSELAEGDRSRMGPGFDRRHDSGL